MHTLRKIKRQQARRELMQSLVHDVLPLIFWHVMVIGAGISISSVMYAFAYMSARI
jgi:hypothetical protein